MSIRLPPGSPAAELCRPDECEGCDGAAPYDRDPPTARLALSPLLRDGMAMAALRADWLQFSGDPGLSRLDDQQLLDAISATLAAGQLRLCSGITNTEGEGEEGAEDGSQTQSKVEAEGQRQAMPSSSSSPASPPPAPRPAPPPPPAAAAPPPPAPAAEPEIDAAAMTAVLLAAARDGVPFCEECEKARKAREAQAA